jgi:hypothetical protein
MSIHPMLNAGEHELEVSFSQDVKTAFKGCLNLAA